VPTAACLAEHKVELTQAVKRKRLPTHMQDADSKEVIKQDICMVPYEVCNTRL